LSEPLPPAPRKPLGVLRGIAAALGIIIMVLTGGCALILVGISFQSIRTDDLELVLIYAGPPFLVGLAIFLAATRLGRR